MSHRPRRLRATRALRDAVAETTLHPRQLVAPYFIVHGENKRETVPSMPGVHRLSPDRLVEEVEKDVAAGIGGVILFGIPPVKDPTGAAAADPAGPVPEALRLLRKAFEPDDLTLMADVCLCEYTDHGHCGIPDTRGHVQNDGSLPQLVAAARAYAEAGADWVAPSDMMDGRVRAIREGLDDAGHSDVAILSYAAKYASAYYGPFRDAAESAPAFGDRRTYQMDPRNVREAVKEIRLDVDEGADMVMVKPALAYLDVIRAARDATDLPLACYNVSGEYSLVKLAAERGIMDEGALVWENLTAMRRAGADLVITYHARAAAENGWLP